MYNNLIGLDSIMYNSDNVQKANKGGDNEE
jgi:hypothetical protein